MFHVEQFDFFARDKSVVASKITNNYIKMKIKSLKQFIRNVPDFPQKGIQFKDVTTLFKNAEAFSLLSDEVYNLYKDKGVTKVVGIESRGFIMGPILANRLGVGFVPVRKPGKLPCEVYEETYEKEYGFDSIQIHKDALSENDIVVLHDDLLATGGTMLAACRLMKHFNMKKIYVNFLIELEDLNARKLFDENIEISSLIKYPI